MHIHPTSHPVKALTLLVAITLFPVNTSAASSKDPWKNCTNIAMGCNAGISLRDDSDETHEPENTLHSTVEQGETISYRGTVAIAELVALAMFPLAMAGVVIDELVFGTLIWTGVFGHGFSGSLVHLYHGNYGKALGSIALRAGLPIVGAASGFLVTGWGGLDFGFAAGLVLAPIIDIVFLASKPKSTTQDQTLIEYGSLKATPSFGVTPRGELTFGLAGHF
jgi:hypothetical protein